MNWGRHGSLCENFTHLLLPQVSVSFLLRLSQLRGDFLQVLLGLPLKLEIELQCCEMGCCQPDMNFSWWLQKSVRIFYLTSSM